MWQLGFEPIQYKVAVHAQVVVKVITPKMH